MEALKRLLASHLDARVDPERVEALGPETSAAPVDSTENGNAEQKVPGPPAPGESDFLYEMSQEHGENGARGYGAHRQGAAESTQISLSCCLHLPDDRYVLLDGLGGSAESSTDDDGGGGIHGDIDLTKLLSSSSSSSYSSDSKGPNLSRQVMTHIRLLHANLQDLKVNVLLPLLDRGGG